jgi:hypothetical protein
MLAEMELKPGVKPIDTIGASIQSLAEMGISGKQSSRWQKLAAVPDDQFEQAVAAAKEVAGEVTTAAMLRIERASRPPIIPVVKPVIIEPENEDAAYNPADDALAEAQELASELVAENIRLRDAVATGQLPADEVMTAASTIVSLRNQVKALQINNDALTKARDAGMREIVQLKKQCAMQAKEIKKLKAQ